MGSFCKTLQKNTKFQNPGDKLRHSVRNFQHKKYIAEKPTKRTGLTILGLNLLVSELAKLYIDLFDYMYVY